MNLVNDKPEIGDSFYALPRCWELTFREKSMVSPTRPGNVQAIL